MTGLRDIPDGYCRQCRKMIPVAIMAGFVTRELISHYTFWAINETTRVDGAKPTTCTGRLADNTITHFMDDPKAAFE